MRKLFFNIYEAKIFKIFNSEPSLIKKRIFLINSFRYKFFDRLLLTSLKPFIIVAQKTIHTFNTSSTIRNAEHYLYNTVTTPNCIHLSIFL